MSKDSSHTYVHMHHPRLADFFEDFTRPYSSLPASSSSIVPGAAAGVASGPNASNSSAAATVTGGATAPGGGGGGGGGTDLTGTTGTTIPSSFLPIEDIYVLPQYQPVNPEDEDDVVPDQHAAFGITRAMETRREPVWRDFGLEELVRRGGGDGGRGGGSGGGAAGGSRGSLGVTPRRVDTRLKDTGRLMGGRRTMCLR